MPPPPSSSHTDLARQLATHFGDRITNDTALLAESSSLCTRYSLSPQQLYYKWAAHAFNEHLPSDQPFTIEHARTLRATIAAEAAAAAAAATTATHTATTATTTPLKPSAHANTKTGHNAALHHILGLGPKPAHPSNTPSLASHHQHHPSPANPGGPPPPPPHAAASPFKTPSRPTPPSAHAAYATPPPSASAYRTQSLNVAAAAATPASDLDSPSLRPRPSSSRATFQPIESLNHHHPLDGSGCQLAASRPLSSNNNAAKKLNSRCTLAVATDPRAWNYRYMFDQKGQRSQLLDDRIDHFASIMREAYHLDPDAELGDPSMPSQEPIYVVGRICPAMPPPGSSSRSAANDASDANDDGFAWNDPSGLPKMAETGIVLEASRMMGSGNRVPIFMQRGCRVRYGPTDPGTAAAGATTVGLFPGQIVMLKGMNGGGERFGVEEILMPPTLPHPASPADELQHNQYGADRLDGRALNVVTVSGPFTEDGDLDFAPWHRVMDALEAGGLPAQADEEGNDDDGDDVMGSAVAAAASSPRRRRGVPDVLILLGPFLSTSHPELPFSPSLPEDLFRTHISSRLNALVSLHPALVVVLIPSTLDILNPHAAYPQPGFPSLASLGLQSKRNIKLLPNPSVFYVNELVFAATTADTLRDLKSEEMVCRIEAGPSTTPSSTAAAASGSKPTPTNKDAMTRLTRHVLNQRSFYPLFPASNSSGLSLDVSHSDLVQFPAVSPDVLLLPSAVKQFVRVVDSTVVVNPGRIAGGGGGGAGGGGGGTGRASLASFHVKPHDVEEVKQAVESGEEALDHYAYTRTRCDILAL